MKGRRRSEGAAMPRRQGATTENTGLYLEEEQRSRRGCIGGRMQPAFHHGLLSLGLYLRRRERTSVRSFLLCTGGGVQTLTFAECRGSMSPRSRSARYSSSGCVCHREMASSGYFAQLPRVPSALGERERFAAVITAQEQVMVRDQTEANGAPVAIGAREPLERGSDVLR
jgi:hypothetical protein